MRQNEPFWAGFSKDLYGRAKRGAQEVIRRIRQNAQRDSLSGYGMLFEDVVPAEFLVGIDETKRNRHFGATPSFGRGSGRSSGRTLRVPGA